MTPTSGIVFFDIDGTLVPSGSSSSYLAAHLGHQPELDAAEDRYARGELSNQQVSEIDAAGWRGARVTNVDLLLQGLPLIPGIDDVLAWCRAQDLEPVLASLAWQPVSAALARRHGFTVSGGPRVGVAQDVYDGTVAEHFDEYDKRDHALDLAQKRGVPTHRCAGRRQQIRHPPLRGSARIARAECRRRYPRRSHRCHRRDRPPPDHAVA